MTENQINLVVAQLGGPICSDTDDGESFYWQFSDSEELQADSCGHLLAMGIQFMQDREWMPILPEDKS